MYIMHKYFKALVDIALCYDIKLAREKKKVKNSITIIMYVEIIDLLPNL